MASYIVNGEVFGTGTYPAIASTFSDGTSNTVLFVEHLALCRNPAGGNTETDGRNVWPATNLTTGDAIIYWPGANTTNAPPGVGPGQFAIHYPNSKPADPANGNTPSWKLPQSKPTMGPSGNCDPMTGSGGHSGGVVCSMGDGSVRFVNTSISVRSWNAALTPKGGEVIGADW